MFLAPIRGQIVQPGGSGLFGPVAIIYDGDSIMNGNGNAQPIDVLAALDLPSTPNVTHQNIAVDGSTTTDRLGAFSGQGAGLIASAKAAGQKVIWWYFAGGNDLNDSVHAGTPASTWSLLQTMYSTARSAGADYVCSCTILPRNSWSDSNGTADRNTLNGLIRAGVGSTSANLFCDYAADPTMGPDGQAAIFGLYSDGVHPQNFPGDQILANRTVPILMSTTQGGSAVTVTGVSPSSGTHNVSTPITITGSGFVSGGTVRDVFVGGVQATSITVVSDTSITCNAVGNLSTVTGILTDVVVVGAQRAGVLPNSWTYT